MHHYPTAEPDAGWFPKAELLRGGQPSPCGVCEPPPVPPLAFCERHLQCIWADARLRPPLLQTVDGEAVRIESAGEWNTGPGPDFLRTTLLIGPDMRRVTGDVEIHVRPADWQRHGHSGDGRYRNVCAHVSYYPGTLPAAALPPGAAQIALRGALDAMPSFSFDNIDLMAYPVAARAEPPPCQAPMKAMAPSVRKAVLDAAGEGRLRRRAELLRTAMLEHGTGQVVYEEAMAALGYRHNKAPFRQLARVLPLEQLRELGRGDVVRTYALLMGCAGLLPDPTTGKKKWDKDTTDFIRRCWNEWWPEADVFAARKIPRGDWVMAGMRPANRPERRLMAAAMWFAPTKGLPEKLVDMAAQVTSPSVQGCMELFALPSPPYWGNRLSFSTPPQKKAHALIGGSRAHALLLNLVLPAMAALGAQAAVWKPLLDALPPEESNELIRQTALRLFGPDHSPTLYRSGLQRQGLIQIHHDFCLGDRTRCVVCPLPRTLDQFHQEGCV